MAINSDNIDDLSKALAAMVVDLESEILERVKRRTPVDTGNARDGWTSQKTANGFTISNDVEYIDYLENGTSKMAPHHMVRTTMEEVDDIVKTSLQKHL